MQRFLVDEQRIQSLRATRQGRASMRGFEYQASYAIARLASLDAQIPLDGLPDVPLALRYDWAEDLDEVTANGTVVFTQCKSTQITPQALGKVLLGFLPKMLFTSTADRDKLRFRLVTSDLNTRLEDIYVRALEYTQRELAKPPVSTSDRSLWMTEFERCGGLNLLAQVSNQLEWVPVSDDHVNSPASGLMHRKERQGLDLLLAERRIHPDWQRQALDDLRRLVRTDFRTGASSRDLLESPVLDRADVGYTLLPYRIERLEALPFLVVNREYLATERRKPKEAYVARPPTWADVVHGADDEVKYVERDQENELSSNIEEHLLYPVNRGSDHRLHALFVLGAPGTGKTTIVRRAAARIVELGKAVVVDLGVNQGRLASDEIDAYLEPLRQLGELGRPVIVVTDDPFFAESGWPSLMEHLGRPGYRNIAVLGATPTYLYETYGRSIAMKQVYSRTLEIGLPSPRERLEISRVFGRNPYPSEGESDELLVIAMEAAAGQSFANIIERMWGTLNDGLPISARTHPDRLPWPVRAFLITTFFHRKDISCPEPLLRASVAQAAASDPDLAGHDAYVAELSQLVFANGWKIFRIEHSGDGSSVRIATMHSRVARKAWELRPRKDFDVAAWVVPASVQTPEAAPEIAQLILACETSSVEPSDQRLHRKVAEAWVDGKVPVSRLCELVEGLHISPRRSADFRPALRQVLRKQNRESWLAALALHRMARAESTEWKVLRDDLTALIKKADLSLSPQTALRLMQSHRYQAAITDRSFVALAGKLPWSLPGELVAHLIWKKPHRIRECLALVLAWLADNPEPALPRLALLEWYRHHAHEPSEEEDYEIIGNAIDWLRVGDSDKVALALLLAVSRSNSTPPALIREAVFAVEDWTKRNADATNVVVALLSFVRQSAARFDIPISDFTRNVHEWLKENPEDHYVREVFLSLIWSLGDKSPMYSAIVAETREWLEGHPDAQGVRAAFLKLLLHGQVNQRLLLSTLDETSTRLDAGLDGNTVRALYLDLIRIKRQEHEVPVLDVVKTTRVWLRANPSPASVWAAFLKLLHAVAPLDEVLSAIDLWKDSDPHDSAPYVTLLALASRVDHRAGLPVADILVQTWSWIRQHPDKVDAVTAFLSFYGRLRDRAGLSPDIIVSEVRSRLADMPEGTALRSSLVSFLPRVPELSPDLLGEIIADVITWMRRRESDVAIREALASALDQLWDLPAMPINEVVAELQEWMSRHQNDRAVREAFESMLRRRALSLGIDEGEVLREVHVNPGQAIVCDKGPQRSAFTSQDR